jgi:hypothetical protein
MRKFTISARTVFELAYILNGISIPASLRNDPIFKRISLAGINSVAIINEILSFRKEIAENNPANLILIKLRTKKDKQPNSPVVLQKCIDSAIMLHNREVYDFMALQRFLPKDHIPIAKVCCQIMASCLQSHIHWCFLETSRYGTVLEFEEREQFPTREHSVPRLFKL